MYRKKLLKRIGAGLLAGGMAVCALAGCAGAPGGDQGQTSAAAGMYGQIDDKEHSRQIFAMDTVMTVTAYGGSEAVMDAVEDRIRQLEALLSTTDEGSEIYAVNRDGGGHVSPDTGRIISYGLNMGDRTDGALDISIYPVLREWGFTTGRFKVPDQAVLDDLLSRVDYSAVELEECSGMVRLEEGMQIDLGSLAKGYTGDCIIEILRDAGISSALLDLGGNVQLLGSKEKGDDWTVAIQNPDMDSGQAYLGILSVSDKAVITSGNYERYFQGPDGKLYWHIIDPETGRPADNGIVSVTVVGDQGIYCDALSTSLFIMGRDKAIGFWKKSGDFEMVIVGSDGLVTVSEGLADRFELIDDKAWRLETVSRK